MITFHHPASSRDRILITGATGFIGHHLLAALLIRGVPCAVLLRPKLAASTRRLAPLLAALDVDLEREVAHGNLTLLEGDLNGRLPNAFGAMIGSILHVAANTSFHRDAAGDPWRTNVEGTRRLLEWASERGIRSLHLVSSAFRCGVATGPVLETIDESPPAFNNTYEHSKWQAELDAREWAARHACTLTVYRPSVVVGHSRTGRTTRFTGFYIMARAAEILARQYEPGDSRRHRTGVRVIGRPDATHDLVPVDHVAELIAYAITDESRHGRVYHITHPDPPTGAVVKAAIDGYFDIAGSEFVDPDELEAARLSPLEQLFHDAARSVQTYVVETPTFDRTNARWLEALASVRCPKYDTAHLQRLIAHAEATRWGRRRATNQERQAPGSESDALIARYFEDYLPRCLAVSRVARMTALTTSMRFVIDDVPDGEWTCRFVRGSLHDVRRSRVTDREDFRYTTTRDVFWSAVAGHVDPQTVFLEDRAQVSGQLEAAMKMATILHQFNREFPCTCETLAAEETWACPKSA